MASLTGLAKATCCLLFPRPQLVLRGTWGHKAAHGSSQSLLCPNQVLLSEFRRPRDTGPMVSTGHQDLGGLFNCVPKF